MNDKLVMKFMDEMSVTFQSSVSGPGEFGLLLQLFPSVIDPSNQTYVIDTIYIILILLVFVDYSQDV